jgi:hypothetical protein
MTHFLIQKDASSKLPMYGFCYETIKSIEFNNWINQDKSYKYTLITLAQLSNISTEWYMDHRIKNRVPVGSVEFVHKYMEVCGLPIPAPINIPEELFGLCIQNPKNISYVCENWYDLGGEKFIKNRNKIKHPRNGRNVLCSEGDWQVTDPVDVLSEWRCFIFKGKMVASKCYSGDQFMTPAEWYIDDCIEVYKSAPIAYTLDITVGRDKERISSVDTVVEVHNMYSCGFYGFEGKYPALMQAAWWNEYL